MRFLCDRMLHELARWLRAAGHDTVIAPAEMGDGAVLESAVAEGRLLLTCDRALARAAGPGEALLLPDTTLDAVATLLRERASVDWLLAPFTRCLLDNTPLVPAEAGAWQRVPERSRGSPGPLERCPDCLRLYWQGGHVRRMEARLRRWSGVDAGERSAVAPYEEPGRGR